MFRFLSGGGEKRAICLAKEIEYAPSSLDVRLLLQLSACMHVVPRWPSNLVISDVTTAHLNATKT